MCPPATAGAVAAFVPAKRGRPVAAEHERLATPPAPLTTRPEPLAPSRTGRFVSTTALETDRVLRRLAAVGSVLVLPLARAAAALVEHTAWQACGFRTQADFTRERLGRDSRWLRQLVSLHRAQERLPALTQALCGADGGSPLGQVAALLVGRVATPENVEVWIDRARQLSLEELRVAVRLASSEPSSLSLDTRSSSIPRCSRLEPKACPRRMSKVHRAAIVAPRWESRRTRVESGCAFRYLLMSGGSSKPGSSCIAVSRAGMRASPVSCPLSWARRRAQAVPRPMTSTRAGKVKRGERRKPSEREWQKHSEREWQKHSAGKRGDGPRARLTRKQRHQVLGHSEKGSEGAEIG